MTSYSTSRKSPDIKTSRPPVAQRPPAAENKIRRLWIACLALAAVAAVSALDYPPLTPNPEAFKARREKFMSKLPPKSVAILRSAPERTMTNDVEYLYRADSDFY
jgi:Aminopeptidase P, N-terminal domain